MDNDTNPYQLTKLVLPELKEAYKLTNGLPYWMRHLLLGALIWLQDHMLTARIQQAITDAEAEYHKQQDSIETHHWQTNARVTITENPDSSHQLPTLTISAPFPKGFPNDGNNNL
jgi:hypothetical protein